MCLSRPMVYDCHHGKDRKVAFKKKYKAGKKGGPDHVWQRNNLMIQDTKKLGCPAKITVNEIITFPQFKVEKDTKSYRDKSSKAIKKALSTLCIENVRKELHVCLPDMSDHRNHPVGEGSGVSLVMDKRVLNYLCDMVREGVGTVLEMKRHLCWFVKNMFAGRELPPRTNRAFFPTKADIRAHMCRAKQKMNSSNEDSINIIQCDNDITGGIESTTNVTEYRQLPTKSHTPRARGPKCRELLKSINNLTYVLDDSTLNDVEVGLHQMYLKLKQSAHKSSGLIVKEKLPSKRKSELLTESQPTKKLRYSKLKMPKKRHPATGRFGTSAEMLKNNYLVNVNAQLNDSTPSV
ncbi:PREDICTED: calcium-responsive transcription factor-like [Priapulus caudatus]|uniref:Calcium-responsive transcription factor-like n=1 Tax=Priapulus caudatus TaxID=37621 RepID=A0ABM1ERT3_PRICU|nr:PREDICTED: calcium-responsive transcription factor-like [Priapulus caudatus]